MAFSMSKLRFDSAMDYTLHVFENYGKSDSVFRLLDRAKDALDMMADDPNVSRDELERSRNYYYRTSSMIKNAKGATDFEKSESRFSKFFGR